MDGKTLSMWRELAPLPNDFVPDGLREEVEARRRSAAERFWRSRVEVLETDGKLDPVMAAIACWIVEDADGGAVSFDTMFRFMELAGSGKGKDA